MKPLKVFSKTSAPTKVILFGEHFVVYNKPAILVAIDKRISVDLSIRNDYRFVVDINGVRDVININDISNEEARLSYTIATIASNILREFNARLGLDIKIKTEVPFGSGLGTSAATSAALATAIANLFNIFDREKIFHMVLEAENMIHGYSSGADPAISVRGGAIIFKRTDDNIFIQQLDANLDLVIIYSGTNRLTKDIVNNVRRIRSENPQLFERFADKSEEITLDALEALKKSDYDTLGLLMLRNHELLRSIGVSNEILDKIVDVAMKNGALGAKLTGAGGGGSVVALVKDKDRLLDALKGYQVFIAKIDEGVRIE